jgi:Mg-chelatase subunit ChlD
MKIKLAATFLVALTAAAIVWLPALSAPNIDTSAVDDPVGIANVVQDQPVIDVVFVLDTTGSMSGLIETAKEKIWSIASTMASAQPTPLIRMGLVAYRDRGDAYVVRTVDLTDDLDSVYAQLMQFAAGGGGDGPESVNAALSTAVHELSWSGGGQAYQTIFLVGDAPPHMDYQDEPQYPEILAAARDRGIVVNAIQCGNVASTRAPWTQIASLGGGSFFHVEQSGSAVAVATPYDRELAELSARLDATRLYYGDESDREAMAAKSAAAASFSETASEEARARRGIFNLSAAGRVNRLGRNELVDAVASGDLDVSDVDADSLPEVLKPMAPAEQRAYVEGLADERAQIEGRMRELAEEREAFLEQEVEAAGGARDSLDQKLYDTISRQAVTAGLEYEDGPAY